MVAGMTPCTVPWDFVAATMNAGYQIELAGKLYHFFKFYLSILTKICRWWLLQRQGSYRSSSDD